VNIRTLCFAFITILVTFFVFVIHFYSLIEEVNSRDLNPYIRNQNGKHAKSIGTTSLTTRLDGGTLRELEDEAKRAGITLSNLAKQVLTNYARWDKLESKAGMIPVAKAVVSEAFHRLNEDDVVRLASSVGKNALKDIILFMKGKVDLDSLFSWLELWLKRNATAGFSYDVQNGLHTCIMKHNLGLKWSLYHKVVLELILREILGDSVDIKVNMAENFLIFKFREHDRKEKDDKNRT
jgi:hypothetical protein